MDVERRWFADFSKEEIEGICARRETVVVVDLWAATTNIVLMLGKKPARLIVINDDKYQAAKKLYKGALLIGQSYQISQEEFAAKSNKTSDIDQVDIAGKTVLYLSFNGARVIEAFSGSDSGQVFVGSMTNLEALVSKLRELDPSKVNVVAAGNLTGEMGGVSFVEDWLGGEAIEMELKGQKFDFATFAERIKQTMTSFDRDDLEDAEEKVWPYIFGRQVVVLPTSFVNRDGFVEVVDYGGSS